MSAAADVVTVDTEKAGVPLGRLVGVELRKMFDTRSGFWLMMSIALVALVATVSVIAFAPDSAITYGTFGAAIGVPFAVILPVIAILSVTSEWSQRTGLVSFTLEPHRGKVLGSKAIAAVIIGVAANVVALVVGAVGNVVGSMINGLDATWDVTWANVGGTLLAGIIGIMVGYMFGLLIRNSAGAIVVYFVYWFVVPTIFGILAAFQDWFTDLQPWVDLNFASGALYDSSMSGENWAQLGTSSLIWLIIPLVIGIWTVQRAEVK